MRDKRLIPKYLLGNAFSLSSSPMTTLFPLFSALQEPNYNNAYKTNLGALNTANLFLLNTSSSVLNTMLKAGLATATSNNAAIAYTGNLMVNDVQSQVSQAPTYVNPTEGQSSEGGGLSANTLNLVNQGLNVFDTAFTALAGEKSEYEGDRGNVTRTLDNAYDSIQGIAGSIPGIGTGVSVLMGLNKTVGNVVNKLGGGTDGMCVCAGTKVFKANGEIVNIEDLEQEDGIIGWNETTEEIKPLIISNIIEPRLKECVLITLKSGQVLKCSIDHPIYTDLLVFVPALDLKVGDVVLSADLDSNLYKLEVINIISIGLLTVYNLQADPDHTYLANGIITHNTTQDAILGSAFFLLSPLGLINGFGGKKADTITKNEEAFEQVGSSYGGTNATVDEALTKSGKKYGLLSRRARRRANREIHEARRQLSVMEDIADEASDRAAVQQSTAAINENRYAFKLQGGYQQGNVRVGKWGMSLELITLSKLIALKDKKPTYKLLKYKEGGIIPTVIELVEDMWKFRDGGQINNPTVIELVEPDFLDNTNKLLKGGSISPKVRDYYKDYNLDDVIVVQDNNARTENDTIYSPSDEFTVHELWHYLSKNKPNESLKEFYDNLDDKRISELGGNLEFVKRTGDPNDFYNPSELEARLHAAKFMSLGLNYTKEFFKNLRKNENKYGDNMRDLLYMFNDDNLEKLFNISATYKFLEGGSVNVIPEGALHARKNNMDMEGITKKGIPVVDNNGDLQAEIEKEEIIYRKSVTEELEKLCKIYYDENTSDKEKDNVALEAGKLLVKETLYNTIDNTKELL